MSRLTLYNWPSPNGRRAAIMMAECGLDHEYVAVDLTRGVQDEPWLRAVNPAGVVPILVDEDGPGGPLVLTQSVAIMRYLSRRTGVLLPADDRSESQVDEAVMFVMSDIAAAAVATFLAHRDGAPGQDVMFLHRLRRFLELTDRRLSERPFLAGDDYSLADLSLYPISVLPVADAAIAQGAPLDALLAWRDRVGRRPAVISGMAMGQE